MLAASHLKCLVLVTAIVALASIGGIIALAVLWQTKLTPFRDYALVVDAGSTHSKIFVYTWPADKSDGLGLTSRVSQETSCDVRGGPITSVTDPSEVNIRQYFDAAMRNCTSRVPDNRKARALIFLGGTAGLRLFELKNSSYTYALLNATRTYFSSLGLLFKSPENQVRIISGSEEGISGWISTNILMRQLFVNNKPDETYGVSDLGGASTQISFVAPNATSDLFSMNLFNTYYDLYSHSYLCYGIEQTRLIYLGQLVRRANGSAIIVDSCLQMNYVQNRTYNDIFGTPCARDQYAPPAGLNTSSVYSFVGTGNATVCADDVRARFDTTQCSSNSCSFDNVYQPKPIPSSLKFVGISNGWFATFNSLAPNISLAPDAAGNYAFNTVNLTSIRRAIDAICNQPWADVPSPDNFRPFLCFNAMYQWTLFDYGYSMTDANLKNFQIIKSVDSNEIGWTLGYMINQTNYLDAESRPTHLLTKGEFIGLLALCICVLIVSAIATLLAVRQYQRRRGFQMT